jgi:hypothetical protein
MYYNVISWRVCADVVVVEKKYLTYSEFLLVALGIPHALRMYSIIIIGLLGCIKFFTLSHERQDIRKKLSLHVKRVF